ncbi:MAG: adenine nucleotide alpha hydrolase, partial [Desulfovibrio sp.]|nr:adenine nucleotide alpha hydrolase [Desulfovibrio sp.]
MLPTDIQTILAGYGSCVVAVSGGVDSLLLAVAAHWTLGRRAFPVHAASPAVPAADAARIRETARAEGFAVREVDAGQMRDPRYLENPVDRCYHCKSRLYAALIGIAREAGAAVIASGTNLDDLSDYRPGLVAA